MATTGLVTCLWRLDVIMENVSLSFIFVTILTTVEMAVMKITTLSVPYINHSVSSVISNAPITDA